MKFKYYLKYGFNFIDTIMLGACILFAVLGLKDGVDNDGALFLFGIYILGFMFRKAWYVVKIKKLNNQWL